MHRTGAGHSARAGGWGQPKGRGPSFSSACVNERTHIEGPEHGWQIRKRSLPKVTERSVEKCSLYFTGVRLWVCFICRREENRTEQTRKPGSCQLAPTGPHRHSWHPQGHTVTKAEPLGQQSSDGICPNVLPLFFIVMCTYIHRVCTVQRNVYW